MEFKLSTVNEIPIVYTDNFHSDEEINLMYAEAEKIRKLGLLNKGGSGGAHKTYKNDKGEEVKEPLAQNQTIFMDRLYHDPRVSDLLSITAKVQDKKLIDYLISLHPYFVTLLQNRRYSSLLSYYDKEQQYKAHMDSAFVTILHWFYKEPKAFTGGEFLIEDKLKIDCVRGRTVWMPSWALHAVLPVVMPKDKQGLGLGRYTLTQFVTQGE